MPSHRGHQKRLEKKKQRRLAARTAPRASASPTSLNGLLRLASAAPFGPAFMSPSWRSEEPKLVTVVMTRMLASGAMVAGTALVDRTCLGVKDGFARQIDSPMALDELIESVGRAHEGDMEEVSVLEAQSVVFNALEYARSLGFGPHRDFPEIVFGPRPEMLIETPLACPERPFFIPGPSDDMARILQTIEATTGVRPALG